MNGTMGGEFKTEREREELMGTATLHVIRWTKKRMGTRSIQNWTIHIESWVDPTVLAGPIHGAGFVKLSRN